MTGIYPVLKINQVKLVQNAKMIVELCQNHHIQVAGVSKGVNGDVGVALALKEGGCQQIASSRIEHLKTYKAIDPNWPTLLLRIPMISEIEEVVAYADYSLVSEYETLNALNDAAKRAGQVHKVILMMDLGDLREGFFDDEATIEMALKVEKEMAHLCLAGIGTNLGCYGAIKPTVENLGRLSHVANCIEMQIDRKLEIVSGGATSSLPLLVSGKMPQGINHLRVGEGLLLNMDLPEIWEVEIAPLHQDVFILEAQVVEFKEKPSHPVGEIFIDAFGNRPTYEDRGIQRRAILAVGKQDFANEEKLIPLDPSIRVIGSSSDHLIVEVDGDRALKVGDTLSFRMYYGPMLHLATSPYVRRMLI